MIVLVVTVIVVVVLLAPIAAVMQRRAYLGRDLQIGMRHAAAQEVGVVPFGDSAATEIDLRKSAPGTRVIVV